MCGYVGNFIVFVHAYAGRWGHRVHIDWQRPLSALSGVHSIMMEKLAQAGEGGGARPPPFTLFTITYKVSDTPPLISSLPLCTVWAGGVNDTANDVFTCAVDIGDQYSVNYVTDNNDIFVASVGGTTPHEKLRTIRRRINDMADNDSLTETFFGNSVTPFL
jgi:hypothetical protein